MKITCPHCGAVIPADRVNVQTDVAACPTCEEVFSVSDIVAGGGDSDGTVLDKPPSGAWFENVGFGWRIGATTRSAGAFFLVPFMCVWSGFSLGGIYGRQIVKGEFNLGMSLFGIPFVLGTIVLGSMAAMMVCGKVVVWTDDDAGRIFIGIGPFGYVRRFSWSSIDRIEESWTRWQRNGRQNEVISLVGETKLSFGSLLSEERRHFFLLGLRYLTAQRKAGQRGVSG